MKDLHQEGSPPGVISLNVFVGNQFVHRDARLAVPLRVSEVLTSVTDSQNVDRLQVITFEKNTRKKGKSMVP